jgi:hypothetical protein
MEEEVSGLFEWQQTSRGPCLVFIGSDADIRHNWTPEGLRYLEEQREKAEAESKREEE